MRIEELSLELPLELEHRAERISELAQQKIQQLDMRGSSDLSEILLPDIDVDASASDSQIAELIARQLEHAIGGSC